MRSTQIIIITRLIGVRGGVWGRDTSNSERAFGNRINGIEVSIKRLLRPLIAQKVPKKPVKRRKNGETRAGTGSEWRDPNKIHKFYV